ncbi:MULTISPECIES: hypothetical protein [unclassified Roseiflexus]|jgi:DNA-directed RNA polymerase subunit RPC12/RpoP|uniref:hypothetical protein n=1 Tax=unclassified Roseiflexus TaxID=2609473 RepID=UPI000312A23D|nr:MULTISPECIES: hypothetical protein [unclassified Roseiflexus]MBO9323193.1 hypothetical protein [Roseiflexus sp.]MCL6539834.1 hypothetical protein [Roseiflexus sp.]
MSDQPLHTLQLRHRHASGAEEWSCPHCGRRLLINLSPVRRRTILAEGDPTALHVGGGGLRQTMPAPLRMNATPRLPVVHDEPGPIPVTDALLPWIRWMEQAGL